MSSWLRRARSSMWILVGNVVSLGKPVRVARVISRMVDDNHGLVSGQGSPRGSCAMNGWQWGILGCQRAQVWTPAGLTNVPNDAGWRWASHGSLGRQIVDKLCTGQFFPTSRPQGATRWTRTRHGRLQRGFPQQHNPWMLCQSQHCQQQLSQPWWCALAPRWRLQMAFGCLSQCQDAPGHRRRLTSMPQITAASGQP